MPKCRVATGSVTVARDADADVGIDGREAMPRSVARARAVARAALLSPECAADIRSEFCRLGAHRPSWFADLCTRAADSGPQPVSGGGAPARQRRRRLDRDRAQVAGGRSGRPGRALRTRPRER